MKTLLSFLMLLLWATAAQAAVIETQEWETMPVPPWAKSSGPVIDAAPTPSSPSGGSALKYTYLAGTYATSLGGGILERSIPGGPYQEIYIGHWMRWSTPYTFNPVGTKIDYFKTNVNCPTISTLCYATVRLGNAPTSLAMDIGIQGNGAYASEPHILFNNVESVNFQLNTWYWLETHIILNTVGSRNGTIEVWVNDVLKARHTNVRFIEVAANVLYLQHAPEWGGSGGTIPTTQYFWVDHTVISTTRIGCPVPASCGAPPPDTTPPTIPSSLTVSP